MKRLTIVLTLLLLLAACAQAETSAEDPPKEAPPAETLDTSPAEDSPDAEPPALEGDALSPDGRFRAQVVGSREGVSTGGPDAAESIQIVDAGTGEVLWEDFGAYGQSILWSPEGHYAALARTARTWCSITILETENWDEWAFTLPDGSAIPEYTFLPDDGPWGVWQNEGTLNLTIGRGGEWGEQKYYSCTITTGGDRFRGNSWEEDRKLLPGSYDFDHDGEPEIVELAAAYGDAASEQVGWYELRVRPADGGFYWSRNVHTSHPGWGTFFACRVDGKDYLLRYLPTMYQGFATYLYELFSLNEQGEEVLVQEGSVWFDINFGSPTHKSFDPEAIAAFLEEVHGLLKDSELLVTTENGEFRSGGPGADFHDDLDLWTQDPLYDDSKSLEENIRAIGDSWQEQQSG